MSQSIAVIIPAYNASQYIKRCVESCMMQQALTEIIVVDDGSTDDTPKIIELLMLKDKRILLYQHPLRENKGRSASRNLGIRKSTSAWITFCDADDYYLEGRFEHFGAFDKEEVDGTYEEVQSVYSQPSLKDTTASTTGVFNPTQSEQLQDFLITEREQRISIIGLIIRKAALRDIELFDVTLNTGEDTDFIWRLAGKGKLKPLRQENAKVIRFVHKANTYQNSNDRLLDQLAFYEKWKNLIPQLSLSPGAQKRISTSYRYYHHMNQYDKAHLLAKPFIKGNYLLKKLFTR